MKMKFALLGFVLSLCFSQGFGDERRIQTFENIDKLVTFRLYNRQMLKHGVLLNVGDKAQLLKSGFKGNLPTLICIHGFMDHENATWVRRTKEEVLFEENVNFITLDYSRVAKNIMYNVVVNFTKAAGVHTGEFLKFLQKEAKIDFGKVHLIGHSLGAQLAGFAARAFPQKKTIGRITGLDPAAPLFEHRPVSERLNPDCAKVVDVIHTCTFFVGVKNPVGTIDFYPNGGFHQPGCSDTNLKCHHNRSREYYYSTIFRDDRNRYIAKKCETLQNALNGTCNGQSATMGHYLNYSSPGIYYLKIE